MISIMSSVMPCNVRKRHVVISGHVLSLLKEIAEALFTREGGAKPHYSLPFLLSRLELDSFVYSERAGTHADTSALFSFGAKRAHEVPASRLVGPAVVVDVRRQVANNPRYQLSVDDIQVLTHCISLLVLLLLLLLL